MRFTSKLLDTLAEGRSTILTFDCEFWHVLNSSGDPPFMTEKEDFFFLPREIGGFVLTKRADGSWEYKAPFYATFRHPKRDTALPISKFATVSPQTGYKLDSIEKQLSLPWGESYLSRLPREEHALWKEGVKAYQTDANIASHHQPPSWIKKLVDLFPSAMVIVKGKNDLYAIQNMCILHGYEYKFPSIVNDIANWNLESRKKCGTAKLEETYMCVKNKFTDITKEFQSILPLQKAHDPSTDASMTFLLALYIQSKEP